MADTTRQLHCGPYVLDLNRPQIVGILNVTPDSFSDGGEHADLEAAVAHAKRMADEGADMIDIGGESTRPGAQSTGVEAEIARVVPVIERLQQELELPVSVDTSKPEVMQAAVQAGASMINDIYALRREGALSMAARLEVPVCLMHMQGEPRTMQHTPHYVDVVREVRAFLHERVGACVDAGIDPTRITIDPGFGFGKTAAHNLVLLRELAQLDGVAHALYIGFSRKRTIGQITGKTDPHARVGGSVAAALLAAERGARLIRVHDVAATKEALDVWQAMHAAV